MGVQEKAQDSISLTSEVCFSQPKKSKVGSNVKAPGPEFTVSSKTVEKFLSLSITTDVGGKPGRRLH